MVSTVAADQCHTEKARLAKKESPSKRMGLLFCLSSPISDLSAPYHPTWDGYFTLGFFANAQNDQSEKSIVF